MRKLAITLLAFASLAILPASADARGHGGRGPGHGGFHGHYDAHRHVHFRDGHRWGGRDRRHYHYCRSWRASVCIAWAAVPVEAAIDAGY